MLVARSKATAAVFIVANALTAGSIFCFPLFGPKITADLGLSLTQTNAIWSSAVVGQYASAAIFGHIADTHGPRPLSLLASVLFGAGYILMSRTETNAIIHADMPEDATQQHRRRANFIAMAVYFLLVGTGVAASLFSALRSSTAHFKSHPGLALSIPLTLFSLSSLFLTSFASLPFFTDPQTGDLNSPRWLAWLGAALMLTNALSAFGLSVPAEDVAQNEESGFDETEADQDRTASERAPLLGSPSRHALPFSVPYYRSARDYPPFPSLAVGEYVSTPAVWIMAIVLFAAVGGAEMVMSSIGSMVVSLRAAAPPSLAPTNDEDTIRLGKETLALRAQQVKLLAIANTAARLVVGLASDLLSPNPTKKRSNDSQVKPGKQISRLSILLFGLALLLVTFAYSGLLLDRVDRLWVVSLATGAGYGLTFTVLPSMIICVWPAQFGRNYGLLTYAAALGSLCFSMLFASINDYVAQHHVDFDEPHGIINSPASIGALLKKGRTPDPAAICSFGRACFAPSFGLAAISIIGALAVTIPLWRAWRSFV